MSDYGTCRDNLDVIEQMMPLTEREEQLAFMQFEYKTSCDLKEEFPNHTVVKSWCKTGLI